MLFEKRNLLILVGLFVFFFAQAQALPPLKTTPSKKKIPIFVFVTEPKRCRPCQQMKPIVAGMKEEYEGRMEVKIVDLNGWKNRPAVEKYKVRTVPALIFYSPKRKELYRHVGPMYKADIIAKWRELGYEF